jgi:A/G-specific adenine glycosylase
MVAESRHAAESPVGDTAPVKGLTQWFAVSARDLPWRVPPREAWGVLVSEVMLQQTPVSRVEPVWLRWMARWPKPSDLAAEPAGESVRMWGRLGYPRRALRLHGAAATITSLHGGRVPADRATLLTLPGVGGYTAAAVMAFAHRRRIPVLDTNVRRVLARVLDGRGQPATASPTAAEHTRLAQLLPTDDEAAAVYSEALMELGAVVCTSRAPSCPACPLAQRCAWLAAGSPDNGPRPGRQVAFAGSDRQVRGRILHLVRSTPRPVAQAEIDLTWAEPRQLRRAQASLLHDGLLQECPDGRFSLPSG